MQILLCDIVSSCKNNVAKLYFQNLLVFFPVYFVSFLQGNYPDNYLSEEVKATDLSPVCTCQQPVRCSMKSRDYFTSLQETKLQECLHRYPLFGTLQKYD